MNTVRRRRFAAFASVVTALLLLAPLSHAGGFFVSPVRVTLSSAEPIAAIVVQNSGSEPALVQLRSTRWLQINGADHYEASDELLATPPIFTVPPGGRQVVRLGLRRAGGAHREGTFRLYLEEVPSVASQRAGGAQVALRLGIPVFVQPAITGPQALQWTLVRAADGSMMIACANTGATHARIASVALSVPGSASPLVEQQVAADVHAEGRSEWKVRAGAAGLNAGSRVRLSAVTERGIETAEVLVP